MLMVKQLFIANGLDLEKDEIKLVLHVMIVKIFITQCNDINALKNQI